jgi:hypothetical protein
MRDAEEPARARHRHRRGDILNRQRQTRANWAGTIDTASEDRIRAQSAFQVWRESRQEYRYGHHIAHIHSAQRTGGRSPMADTGIVRGEAVELLHRDLELLVWPCADLIADPPKGISSNPRGIPSESLNEVHLLLDAGLYSTVRAVMTQVADSTFEVLHQGIEVWVGAGQRPEITHEAREQSW